MSLAERGDDPLPGAGEERHVVRMGHHLARGPAPPHLEPARALGGDLRVEHPEAHRVLPRLVLDLVAGLDRHTVRGLRRRHRHCERNVTTRHPPPPTDPTDPTRPDPTAGDLDRAPALRRDDMGARPQRQAAPWGSPRRGGEAAPRAGSRVRVDAAGYSARSALQMRRCSNSARTRVRAPRRGRARSAGSVTYPRSAPARAGYRALEVVRCAVPADRVPVAIGEDHPRADLEGGRHLRRDRIVALARADGRERDPTGTRDVT